MNLVGRVGILLFAIPPVAAEISACFQRNKWLGEDIPRIPHLNVKGFCVIVSGIDDRGRYKYNEELWLGFGN